MATQVQIPGHTMANTPRPAADGMDSEILRQQDLKNAAQQPRHLRISPPSGNRHRNLNTSPSSASFSKATSSTYIPHEPVRGAVKAVTVAPGPITPFRNATGASSKRLESPEKTTVKFPEAKFNTPKSMLNAPNFTGQGTLKGPNVGLSQNRISYEYSVKPEMTIKEAVGTLPSRTSTMTNSNKELPKTIEVPFYNAPGHLSAKTYQTIEKYQKEQLDKELNKPPMPKLTDDHIVLEMSPAKLDPKPQVSVTIDTDCRSVEGQVTTPTDTLNKEIENLKEQLSVQTKINGDLKKLLVASMGDDLHHRVECLVRTNAQLGQELGLYSNKISQDGEDLDQLGIQADMWRSKYHASRVQVDELLSLKSALCNHHEEACSAIEELLRERYELRDSLFSTYRILQQLSDAFEPLPPTNRPPSYAPRSVTDISGRNYKLADNMKFRLLGTIQMYPALYNIPTPNVMTPAEQMGLKVLAEKPEALDSDAGDQPVVQQQGNNMQHAKFSRYNPHPCAKYDNVTFNCCRKCKGEIKIV